MRISTKIALLATVAIATGLAVPTASAMELWDPHLRGVNEGMASGASVPTGVYGVLNNYFVSFDQYDAKGHKDGVKLDALVEVPMVLWQTGYQFLGADLAVAVAQPFDYTNLKASGVVSLSGNGHWGTFNTIFVPYQLSWTLPENFHVSTNLSIYADDATSSPADPPGGGGIGSGNAYWTLEPTLAASWLSDGWNLSVEMHYAYNFKDSKTDYRSGQQLSVDYTATKAIGKWTVGLGASQQNQLTDDTGVGATACAAKNGCRAESYSIGPVVGYRFDGLSVEATYNQNLHARNDVAGTFFNLRLVSAL